MHNQNYNLRDYGKHINLQLTVYFKNRIVCKNINFLSTSKSMKISQPTLHLFLKTFNLFKYLSMSDLFTTSSCVLLQHFDKHMNIYNYPHHKKNYGIQLFDVSFMLD